MRGHAATAACSVFAWSLVCGCTRGAQNQPATPVSAVTAPGTSADGDRVKPGAESGTPQSIPAASAASGDAPGTGTPSTLPRAATASPGTANTLPASGGGPVKGPAGLVPGGLARGTDEPADKELLEGDRAYRAGDFAAAKKHYEAAKKLAPKDPAPAVGVLRVRFASGEIPTDYASAPNNPRVKALLAEVDAALKKSADYGPLHLERGRLLLVVGKADAALSSLERGAALSPDDPEGQSALGLALLATGKSEQALEHLRRASEIDPDDPDRLTNLGTALMMRGKVPEAVVAYRRAVDLAPNDPRVLSDLGTAYLSQNRAKDAKPYLERAVELAPDKATFLSNLGYAQQQLGDVPGAIATYKKAIEKDPKLGSAWINLGNALADDGKFDEAERAYKKAVELDPTDPRPKASLKELAELRKSRGAK